MKIWSIDGMLPIRKIDSYKVALTTYYGKNFVTRSDKKANSSYKWLISQINKLSISDQTHIKNVAPANVFSNNFEAPYIYSALSTTYKSLKAGNLNLVFDYVQRETLVTPNVLAYIEQEGRRLVGLTDQGYPVIIDKDNIFHYLKDVEIIPIGDIYQVLQLPVASSPVDFTEVRIYSKTVPVGIVLSYFIGFKSLLTLLDVKYRVVEGKRVTGLGTNDYAISFKNEHYVFSRSDVTASLILGGFLDYAKQIRLYDTSEFNKKDVYLNLLASKGITAIYIRELELCDKLFVDPITKSILIDLNEPVTFRGLLIRATELLKDFHHPDAQDTKYMRIRGYERISGFIYKELTTSIKSFKNRNISGKSKVEMGPYQVWQSIMTDPSLKLPEDTNPVQNLKENEVVTYVGEGGRSKDTMTASSRAYHINDMGVISESTVDSSDVGISAFLSSNPNFKNLRGIIDLEKSVSPTSLVSTTGNLSIGTNHDSAIRSAFSAIQASHVIATDGYRQPYLRTGYEYVIGHRTTEMFCYTAKDNGKVIGKTKLGITVQYDNGKVKGVSLGRLYGKAEGSMYPHDVVTTLKVGDTFTKGQTISYNTGFFEPDMLDPNSVVYKTTMLVKTVLWESSQTFEDSSSISKSLSNKLSAKTTKVKSIDVDFTQNLLEVIKPGTYVHPKDTLMIIVDEVVSGTGYFDEESLSVLRRLSKQSPASKYEGTIDKIEVFYHGSKDDMSSSLRSLADVSDKYLSDSAKASNKPVINGQVNSDYRVNGKPLAPDRAEIKVYITISTGAGVGD